MRAARKRKSSLKDEEPIKHRQVKALSAACRDIDMQVSTLMNLAKDPTLSAQRKAEIKAAIDELNETQDNLLDEVFAEDTVDDDGTGDEGMDDGEGDLDDGEGMDEMGDDFDVVAEGVDDIEVEDVASEGETDDVGMELDQLEARVRRLRANAGSMPETKQLEARVARLRAKVRAGARGKQTLKSALQAAVGKMVRTPMLAMFIDQEAKKFKKGLVALDLDADPENALMAALKFAQTNSDFVIVAPDDDAGWPYAMLTKQTYEQVLVAFKQAKKNGSLSEFD